MFFFHLFEKRVATKEGSFFQKIKFFTLKKRKRENKKTHTIKNFGVENVSVDVVLCFCCKKIFCVFGKKEISRRCCFCSRYFSKIFFDFFFVFSSWFFWGFDVLLYFWFSLGKKCEIERREVEFGESIIYSSKN